MRIFYIGINPIIDIPSFLTTSFEFYEYSIMDLMPIKCPTILALPSISENIKTSRSSRDTV